MKRALLNLGTLHIMRLARYWKVEYMHRIATILTLIGLLCQHATCCCTIVAATSQDDDRVGECCDHHGHGEHAHGHKSDEHSDPADGHTHHLCVGTHIFYLPTPSEIPASDISLVALPCSFRVNVASLNPSDSGLTQAFIDSLAPLPSLPLRAMMQIYLI